MGRLKGWLKQLRALLVKDAVEREMDEEMAFHVDMETEKNLRAGMSAEEARRAALVAFGGVERYKERVRDARWTRVPEDLLSDLRHAVRRLVRRPSFSLTGALALAVGLAALGTAYGLVYGVLLRPLPYPDGDRLVHVWQTLPGWQRFPASWPTYERWREETSSFTALAAWRSDEDMGLAGEAGVERVAAVPATAALLDVLGIHPARGRWFTAEEDRSGARVAVVSHAFRETRMGGDPDAVGRVVELDEEPYTVIGVMPPGTAFPSARTDLWIPLGPDVRAGGWNSQSLAVIGRLAEGRTPASAARDVAGVTERFVAAGNGPEVGSRVVPVREDRTGGVRGTLLLALAAAAAVLLIGVLDVANLFLARGVTARGEIAVRAALGAGRLRLARGLVFEGLLVALTGAAAGLVAVGLATRGLTAALAGRVPRLDAVAVDGPVVLGVLGVAAGVGVALGLLATLAAVRGGSPVAATGPGARQTASRGARLFRSTLVAGQVAAVCVLLSGAGLLLRSLDRLLAEERGFDGSRVLALVEPRPPEGRYPDDAARLALYGRVAERVAAVPGVRATALVAPLPFSGSERNHGLTLPGSDAPIDVGMTEASAGAFDVLGIPLLAGRVFDPGEGPDAGVAVVGEALARRLGTPPDVLGSRLPLDGTSLVILGVVGDVRQEGLDESPVPRVWVPWGWSPDDDAAVVAATTGAAERSLPEVRAALLDVEPAFAADRLVPLESLVGETASFPRFRAVLLLILALAAGLLAAVGIYGVTSYAVVERRRELSIRSALGARRREVVVDAMGRELRVVALGLLVGAPAAILAARTLRGFLYEVVPEDPLVHAATVAGILAVGALSALLPALRAVRTDPAEVLRGD